MSIVFWFILAFGAVPLLIGGIILTLGYGKDLLAGSILQARNNAACIMKRDCCAHLV